jgi:hypothetical protein
LAAVTILYNIIYVRRRVGFLNTYWPCPRALPIVSFG